MQDMSEQAIGSEVTRVDLGDAGHIRHYLVDRPAYTESMRAVEAVMEISLRLPRPPQLVWPLVKDFNRWMNRIGYVWDRAPADHENEFVHLLNTGTAGSPQKVSAGSGTRYVVRKVIPSRLIHLDSLPSRMIGKDCTWSGHNVMTFQEEDGNTRLSNFMEHTFYSESMSLEDLRAHTRKVLAGAVGFWSEAFIPDLLSLIEGGCSGGAGSIARSVVQ
jgi:hypothetical protein